MRPIESTPDTSSDLRLSQVLGERLKHEGTYVALARAISLANGVDVDALPRNASSSPPKGVIDRRKLRSIIKHEASLVLSLSELHALDRYLERFGEGLAYHPIFYKPEVLGTLADSGRVTFFLGSKPDESEPRINLSHWDVISMAELQRGMYSFTRNVAFDIQDVLLRGDVEGARASLDEDWVELLGDTGPSLICLGSTRATHAADLMLSRMFRQTAFPEGSPPRSATELPFHFIWAPERHHVFPSAFHLSPEDVALRDPGPGRRILQRHACGLSIGGSTYLDEVSSHGRGKTYGVCVVQRRRRGQIWLVVAGITGAATFAAAQLVKRMVANLEHRPGHDSPVYWMAIEADVEKDETRPDVPLHTVTNGQIIHMPESWPPTDGR